MVVDDAAVLQVGEGEDVGRRRTPADPREQQITVIWRMHDLEHDLIITLRHLVARTERHGDVGRRHRAAASFAHHQVADLDHPIQREPIVVEGCRRNGSVAVGVVADASEAVEAVVDTLRIVDAR